jgi:hypothetical protein
MKKIHVLENITKPNKELILWAEGMVERIKSGEIKCAAFVALDNSGNPIRGWSGSVDPIGMMGALQLLNVEFNLKMTQHLNDN